MRREQLEHVLRAASTVVGERDILVIGSQAILGTIADDVLPAEATTSIEADLAFLDDPADEKADQVDGAIGELSTFHETYGYYAQGVSVATEPPCRRVGATDSSAWTRRLQCRVASFASSHTIALFRSWWRVAGRITIFFAAALLREHLIDPVVLIERIDLLSLPVEQKTRLRAWVDKHRTTRQGQQPAG